MCRQLTRPSQRPRSIPELESCDASIPADQRILHKISEDIIMIHYGYVGIRFVWIPDLDVRLVGTSNRLQASIITDEFPYVLKRICVVEAPVFFFGFAPGSFITKDEWGPFLVSGDIWQNVPFPFIHLWLLVCLWPDLFGHPTRRVLSNPVSTGVIAHAFCASLNLRVFSKYSNFGLFH